MNVLEKEIKWPRSFMPSWSLHIYNLTYYEFYLYVSLLLIVCKCTCSLNIDQSLVVQQQHQWTAYCPLCSQSCCHLCVNDVGKELSFVDGLFGNIELELAHLITTSVAFVYDTQMTDRCLSSVTDDLCCFLQGFCLLCQKSITHSLWGVLVYSLLLPCDNVQQWK